MVFWLFYNEVTGRNTTIVKKTYLIEDNTGALEETNQAALDKNIKQNYIEVKTKVATEDREIDEDDTGVGEE